MGNATTGAPARNSCPKAQFEFVCVVGRGGYGRVWQVLQKPAMRPYAMKVMRKSRIVAKKSVQSVMNERRLLAVLKHPFIVNMQRAFQDTEHLYLAMDLMRGGDLRFNFIRNKGFNEAQTRFFVACLVTALEYLHLNGIVHRDIKPENLVLDERGYLRLTDFGIAQNGSEVTDFSGTPGYMAPEVMGRLPHGATVDYFAVGVIVYEFMKGRRPYIGETRRHIKEMMLSRQVALTRSEVPSGWSLEAADFVNKLLIRKPTDRLGANGPLELKNHCWLRDFPWKRLFEKRLPSPFRPQSSNNYDESMYKHWPEERETVLPPERYSGLFPGYLFNSDDASPRSKANSKANSKVNSRAGSKAGSEADSKAASPAQSTIGLQR